MKTIIWNILLFVALAFAFSSLTGCGGGSNVANAPANLSGPENTNTATAETNAEKPSSEYPPLASAIAQADLKTRDGSTFKIADKKGKVILINMWATWCGPCLEEMPALVKIQDKYGPHGFEILGLDADDEPETVTDQIAKVVSDKGINYQIVFSDAQTQAALVNLSKFGGIPQSFLIDADGNLRGVFRGANKENLSKIDQMVGEMVGQPKS